MNDRAFLTRLPRLVYSALAAALVSISATGPISAREWIASDGRKLVADFVSATDTEVKVKRRSDGREFTIQLDTLSEADQKWVNENKDKPVPPRIGLDPEAKEAKEAEGSPYRKLLTGEWEMAEFRKLPYAIYGGADLDPAKKYPLVLGLHGKSENNENGKQTGILDSFTKEKIYQETPAILVAPLCFQPYGASGGGWDREPGDLAVKLVEDMLKRFSMVDEKRIYVLGYSMGGGGTATLITKEPRLFAAGIVIAGWVDAGAAKAFKKVPVWAFHGSADDVVKPDSIQKLARSLKRSEIFKYTEYEGADHGIIAKVWAEPGVHKWLFSQSQ